MRMRYAACAAFVAFGTAAPLFPVSGSWFLVPVRGLIVFACLRAVHVVPRVCLCVCVCVYPKAKLHPADYAMKRKVICGRSKSELEVLLPSLDVSRFGC